MTPAARQAALDAAAETIRTAEEARTLAAEFETYNAEVLAARAAYAADRAVEEGFCAVCKERLKNSRRCKTCERAGRQEGDR